MMLIKFSHIDLSCKCHPIKVVKNNWAFLCKSNYQVKLINISLNRKRSALLGLFTPALCFREWLSASSNSIVHPRVWSGLQASTLYVPHGWRANPTTASTLH